MTWVKAIQLTKSLAQLSTSSWWYLFNSRGNRIPDAAYRRARKERHSVRNRTRWRSSRMKTLP